MEKPPQLLLVLFLLPLTATVAAPQEFGVIFRAFGVNFLGFRVPFTGFRVNLRGFRVSFQGDLSPLGILGPFQRFGVPFIGFGPLSQGA